MNLDTVFLVVHVTILLPQKRLMTPANVVSNFPKKSSMYFYTFKIVIEGQQFTGLL